MNPLNPISSSLRRAAVVVVLTIGLLLPTTAGAGETEGEETVSKDFFEASLDGLIIGTPGVWDEITVFPIVAPKAPAPLAIDAGSAAAGLRIKDRTTRRHEYDLVLRNEGDRAVLLLGGSVITGGKMERVVPSDVLLPAKSGDVDLDTLAASASWELLPEAKRKPQRLADVMAPKYLRELIEDRRTNRSVRRFLENFDGLRTGDEAPTLSGTADADPLKEFCIACQGDVANFPRLNRPTTIGFITAVGDRLQTLELFGSNDLLRQSFRPILAAHAFRVAAEAVRRGELEEELPKVDAVKRLESLRTDAEWLLGALRDRGYTRDDEVESDSAGEALDIWIRGARGRAIGIDGRLVHATVFRHDPFERALFDDPLQFDQETRAKNVGTEELKRRGDRGTLTEYERRLLERRSARDPLGAPR